ncbi:hypothetical protein WICPIJ_005413 [Wickerhamomyces pijperi]|uniref:Conserved oligomeric Golgi complex subunit 4 n=1 Tax=Wickerhamomyces pijperi TaxID=599730 RepID=A0A9P8TME0_WICPI|nr:hypothetical protein WICPIJ_005413 [Wickerhamomyces pijperi]
MTQDFDKNSSSARYSKLLHRLTTPDQLNKFIHSINTTSSQLAQELDQYIDTSSHVVESRKLELARTELSTSLNVSSDLVSLLSQAGDHAVEITAKVRILDIERERVKETLRYVIEVRELKALILSTYQAIDVRDFAKAAENLQKIGELRTINGQFINVVVPSTDVPEIPEVIVAKWVAQLTELFTKEFVKASESRDVENLTFFFRLFPLIGKASIGLDCYSKFICDIISSQSRLIISNQQSQTQQEKMGFFPLALTRLLEIISKMINQHSIIIAKYYGTQYMNDIIEKVSKETDSQAGLICDMFYETRCLDRVVQEVDSYRFQPITNQIIATNKQNSGNTPGGSNQGSQPNSSRPSMDTHQRPAGNANEDGDLSQINDLILELSNFCKYWGMYCKFIAVKWKEYQPQPQTQSQPQTQELKLPAPILNSKFSLKLQTKILPTFEHLIHFFIKKSFNQSFQLEEFPDLNPYLLAKRRVDTPPDSPPVSSIAEDLTLILTSVFKLSIETAQPMTLVKIVSVIKRSIKEDFLLIIVKRMKELYPRQGTNLTAINVSNLMANSTHSLGSHSGAVSGIIGGGGTGGGGGNLSRQSAMNSLFQRGASALTELTKTDDEEKLHYFTIYLNSLSLSLNYLQNLISLNSQLITVNFSFGSDSTKLNNLLTNSFKESMSEEFEMIINEHVTVLFNQCLKSKLQSLVNDLFSGSAQEDSKPFLISNSTAADSSHNSKDNLAQFLKQWTQIITPFTQVLHLQTYNVLLDLIITHIATLIERKIWTSLDQNINELGSIKLEREMSLLISELTKGKYYHLRERFVRVTQIIMIIGMDFDDGQTVDDQQEEIDAAFEWRLSPMERRKAKALRVDR